MARRFLIFSVGFLFGCVLVYNVIFKDTNRQFYGSWLPDGRVLKKIGQSLNRVDPSYNCILEKADIFSSEVDELLEDGDIDFEISDTKGEIKTYFITLDEGDKRNIIAEIALQKDSAWITKIGISKLSFEACE